MGMSIQFFSYACSLMYTQTVLSQFGYENNLEFLNDYKLQVLHDDYKS